MTRLLLTAAVAVGLAPGVDVLPGAKATASDGRADSKRVCAVVSLRRLHDAGAECTIVVGR